MYADILKADILKIMRECSTFEAQSKIRAIERKHAKQCALRAERTQYKQIQQRTKQILRTRHK